MASLDVWACRIDRDCRIDVRRVNLYDVVQRRWVMVSLSPLGGQEGQFCHFCQFCQFLNLLSVTVRRPGVGVATSVRPYLRIINVS